MDGMGEELREQSGVWRHLWRRRDEVAEVSARVCPRPLERLLLTGCGDCHAAAEYGEALLDLRSVMPVRGFPPMELGRARPHLLGPGSLLVAMSVSGRTPRVLEAVGVALRQGASVLGLTDDPESPLARRASRRFILGTAPPETLGRTDYRDPEAALYTGYHRPVPQTKTFGALQSVLAMLCLEWERLGPSGRGSPLEAVEADLAGLPELAAAGARAAEAAAESLLERVRPRCRITFCGTGWNGSSARFCAYKLLELTVPADFSDIEEFCHTRYLTTERGDAVVFLVEGEGALERVGEIAPVVEDELGAASVTLSTAPEGPEGPDGLGRTTPRFFAGPVTPEVSPLVLAHAGAHLVRRLALSWGLDTDRFRAGVEEERYVRGSTRMIRESKIR